MFRLILPWLLLCTYLLTASVEAADGVYVLGKSDRSVSFDNKAGLLEPFVEDYFSKNSEFNYYSRDVLSTRSSIFLDGLAPRFVDFNYNGFSLRDPSSPEGIFDFSLLVGLTGEKSISKNGNRLLIKNDHSEKSFIEFGVSSLGEADTAFQKNKCTESYCYSAGTRLQRGGGYSQREGGREDDYFHRLGVNFNGIRYRDSYEDHTLMFYSGGVFDEDGSASAPSESLVAESKESVIFVGKRLKFKDLEVQASYFRSYRKQEDNADGSVSRQKGQVFEVGASFKNFGVKVFNERFDNGSLSSFGFFKEKDLDSGFEVSFDKSWQSQSFASNIGYTEKRDFYGDIEWTYKNLGLFYKAVPASLYQASYNKLQPSTGEELKTQNMLGLRYEMDLLKNDFVNIGVRVSYTRAYEFIDYYYSVLTSSGAYFNLDEVETALVKLKADMKYFSFYVQRQHARNVDTKVDLLRRPDWTLGLNASKKISQVKLNADVKWVSSRTDFGSVYLKAFWETRVRLGYKNFELSARNILSEDTVILDGFKRRPFSLELKYQKTF